MIICVVTYHRNGGGAQGKEVVWVYASVGPIHFLLGHGDHPMSAVTWGGSLFAGLSGIATLAYLLLFGTRPSLSGFEHGFVHLFPY